MCTNRSSGRGWVSGSAFGLADVRRCVPAGTHLRGLLGFGLQPRRRAHFAAQGRHLGMHAGNLPPDVLQR